MRIASLEGKLTGCDHHNRHGELAEALGFRLGGGRGKILFQLQDRPMTLSELAEANSLDAPYVTLIVDKLEAHGLVERQPTQATGAASW